jgi:hypothetical protein
MQCACAVLYCHLWSVQDAVRMRRIILSSVVCPACSVRMRRIILSSVACPACSAHAPYYIVICGLSGMQCACAVLYCHLWPVRHAVRMRRVILSSVVCPSVPYFSTFTHKRRDFREKIVEQKCVF